MVTKPLYLSHPTLMRFASYLSATLALAATLASSPARSQIQPSGSTQVHLNGSQFDISGGTLSSDGANLFHSFAQFGLSAGQIANFLSTTQLQNIFGRIIGSDPSFINGLLQISGSQANLYLMNPAGFVFGPQASLNVGGDFFATTATGIGFSNGEWFDAFGNSELANLNGNPHQFAFDLSQAGSIVNAGHLAVPPGQNLTLLGGRVANTGQLSAPGGQITVTAIPDTGRVRISQPGQLLSLEIVPPRDSSGQLLPLSPLDLPELLVGSGLAAGLNVNPDRTVSVAGSDLRVPLAAGASLVSGRLDTAGSGTPGGRIDVLGDRLALIEANLDASGSSGGSIRLGGDYLGQGEIPNAQQLFVSADTHITANAGEAGDGGRVILWSDDTTSFYGNLSARGGHSAGNGGFVEVSGQQDLIFRGEVDLSAANGTAGSLLLDPQNITIVNGGGGANDGALPTIFSGTAPGANFTISETALEALASNLNITLQATNDIIINDLADNNLNFVPGPGVGGVTIAFSAGNNFTMLDLGDTITATHKTIAITAGNAIAIGNLNTGTGTATSGNIILNAGGNVRTGSLNTAVTTGGGGSINLAGNVAITSGGTIAVTGPITASANLLFASIAAKGGDIALRTTNLGGNISFVSINTGAAKGGAQTTGGNVAIAARGTVFGTGTGLTINTQTIGGPAGTISITHDGGPNNLPFIVSGATANGTAGSIQGANLLATGNFPVLPNGGPAAGTPGGIAIVSINSPPALNALPAVSAAPGQTLTFSFADLAAQVSDPDLDNVTLTISPLTERGTLAVNGVPVTGTVTLNPGDVLTFTADSGIVGSVELFALQASDVVSSSAEQTVTAIGASLSTCPPFCDEARDEADLAALPDEAAWLDWELLSNFCRARQRGIASIERLYSREYSRFFGLPEPEQVRDRAAAQQALQQAQVATGHTSALVYLAFCPCELLPSVAAEAQQQLKQLPDAPTAEAGESGESLNRQQRDDDQLVLALVPPEGEPLRYPLGVSRAEVEAIALEFRRTVTNPQRLPTNYQVPAEQMYNWLLEPLEDDLQRLGIEHLIYIPDAGLRLIPLAAMHDGADFAIARYSFSLVPSLTLTNVQPAKLQGLRVLAMGAEFFREQPPLPAVPVEVRAIAEQLWTGKAYLNEEFTLPNLQAARQQGSYGIVHLATHSDFQPGQPADSYIQLTDTRVHLDELDQLELDLPSVELLVLSACRTALGDPSAELGFAGLALASGAKSALGSLWYVSDGGTLVLMTAFYDQLRSAPYRAAALRQAQLALLRGEAKLEPGRAVQRNGAIALPPELRLGSPDLAHPYYWSAFTLVGTPW